MLMFFSTELLLKMNLVIKHDFATQSKIFFENIVKIIWLKYFHDSVNIAVTLAPGREFFSAKYV